MNLKWDYKV